MSSEPSGLRSVCTTSPARIGSNASRPVCVFQILAEPSALCTRSKRPSGVKRGRLVSAPWTSVNSARPEGTSHSLAVASLEVVANIFPSGENAD